MVNPILIAWWRTCKALPASFTEYGLYQKNYKQWRLRVYILFWKTPPEFFRFVNLLLENKILPLWILQNCVTPLQVFKPSFLAKFPDSPWLFGSQVPWLSLSLARNELQGSQIFPNFQNFKEILLMLYGYHKAAFTFKVRFSTSTYDAKWMCSNFTHILMNIVGNIDLHESVQTFSIRIVWQRKFWSYTPHKVKKM